MLGGGITRDGHGSSGFLRCLRSVLLREADDEQHDHGDRRDDLRRDRFGIRIQADPIVGRHAAQICAFDEVAFDQRVHAAAREDDDQHGHQNRRDEEERADRNLHRGESQHEEDHEQHHGRGDATDPHAVRILAHRIDRFVEDHRFGAFAEHREEAQQSERGDHAEAHALVGARIGHGRFGFVADIPVPGFDGAFVEHPIAGPQQHDHRDQRAHALGDLLDRAGAAEQEREQHRDQPRSRKTREHAEVNPLGEALVAGFDEIRDHRGHDEQRFQTLADQNEERLTGGAGDELREAVGVIGRAAVERRRIFHKPAFQVVDELLDFLVGAAVTHGLAGHLELVFDL